MIDPNVWIAALINPYGTPARVLHAVMTGQVRAVVSPHLLEELTAILVREKFRRWVSLGDAVAFVESLGGRAELHPDRQPAGRRLRDNDDEYLVALAEATGSVTVTGDADILDADLDPPAITPRALIDVLDGGS